MSRIDELVERLCPEGVEYRALGEVASYVRTRVPASSLKPGSYVGVNELLPDYRGRSDEIRLPAEESCVAFEPGDILLGNIRPYLKKLWLADSPGGTNGDVLVIRVNDPGVMSPAFLREVLMGEGFTSYNVQKSRGAKMPRGDKKAILQYRIPVPPLAVQEEVVRVLDSFAELEAELEAELAARRRQYAYYRDQLLDFTEREDVSWLTLGGLAKVRSSKRVFKNEFRHQGIPFYRGTEIGMLAEGKRLEPSLFIDESHYLELIEQTGKIENGDLLLPSICPDGRVWCVDSDEPFYIKDGRVLWICSFVEGVDSRYLCYQISSLLVHRYSSYASGASFAELKIFALEKMLIPVPPLAEQQRIAGILDEFDALTTSLADGLPAEIAARRVQYAYWRDRLLTFSEKPVA